MNKSLFEVSRVLTIDDGEEFNVWNGDSVVLPASFKPNLFEVSFACDVSRYVEEEESNLITDRIMVYAIIEHGFVTNIEWDVWQSDNDYGIFSVNNKSFAWYSELVPNTLQVALNRVRVECGVAVWEKLREEYNVDMNIEY